MAERWQEGAWGAALIGLGGILVKAWSHLRQRSMELATEREREQNAAEVEFRNELRAEIADLRRELAEARGAYEAERQRARDAESEANSLRIQLAASAVIQEDRMKELDRLRQEVAALRQRVGDGS